MIDTDIEVIRCLDGTVKMVCAGAKINMTRDQARKLAGLLEDATPHEPSTAEKFCITAVVLALLVVLIVIALCV